MLNTKQIKLSKRLQASVDFVTCHSRVADIGCDHAYASIYLVQNTIADFCIAMDVKEGPLAKAKENIEKYGCKDKVETRLSDGLAKLKIGEVDTILITGMGGVLIQKILKDAKEVLANSKELIVQPQSDQELVRKYLHQLMFDIKEETMVKEDGKYYTSIYAVNNSYPVEKKAKRYAKKIDYLFGKKLLDKKDPCLFEYLQKKKRKYQQILCHMENLGKTTKNEDYNKIQKMISDIKEALNRY